MAKHPPAPWRRERFLAPGAGVLRLLLAQDGSTTRLCETIAGGPVGLQVLHQAATDAVPALVREMLPGSRFIERIATLGAHGEVMMDALAYIALQGLDARLQRDLEAGVAPIGHLLGRLWLRREAVPDAAALHERLWRAVGTPDPAATRAYRIVTPEGPRMLIVETFRRGMLMERMPSRRAP